MKKNEFKPVVQVRLYHNEKCFGPGIASLLSCVKESSSLRSAASSMEMSYSKAWNILHNCEKELGFKLLDVTTGGKGGGGAKLTEPAEHLLERYMAYQKAIKDYAEAEFENYFGDIK